MAPDASPAPVQCLKQCASLGHQCVPRIREPERLGASLATTARRECLRHIRLHGHELPREAAAVFESPDDEAPELAATAASTAVVKRSASTTPTAVTSEPGP